MPHMARGRAFAAPWQRAADSASAIRRLPALHPVLALTALVALLAVAAWLAVRGNRRAERHRTMATLLDAADQLEARLRTARSEIEAIAGDDADPIRSAMQEMLRQRLWLQQHGDAASIAQLAAVRDSIRGARVRIDQQLVQIERARALLH